MKSAFKKWELYEKTHKKVKKKRYLAKTSFILNVSKRAFQIWIQHKISMYNMKFIKIFFGGPYGDFSDIKFFLVKTQQPLLIPIFFTTTYLLHSFKWPSIYKVTCPI